MNCPACQRAIDAASRTCPGCGAPLPVVAGCLIAGRYLVLERLGEGGMGTVFKARDRMLEATVALKVVRLGHEPRAVRRFHAEIRLARKVKHRNVCSLYEYGEDGEVVYCTMELVEGKNLRQTLGEGLLDWQKAYDFALQAAEGLQAIHEAGVIHRDLKAANLMIDARGVARLVDFGIAKELPKVGTDDTPTPSGGDTESGYFMGTPDYASPEQLHGWPLDARSDIYSLGIVIYEIFTGCVPFRGETREATVAKHLEEPPSFPGTVPEALVPVLRRALAKQRGQRYPSVRDLIKELRRASQETATTPIRNLPAPPRWLLWVLLIPASLVALTWLLIGIPSTQRDLPTATTLPEAPTTIAAATPTPPAPPPAGTPTATPKKARTAPITTSPTSLPITTTTTFSSTTTAPPTTTLPPPTTLPPTTTTTTPRMLSSGDPCPSDADLVRPECPVCPLSETSPVADRLNLQGEVDIVIVVDEKGRVADAEVAAVRAQSNESLLRDLALRSVRKRQYRPATWHGVPCKAHVSVTLKYVR